MTAAIEGAFQVDGLSPVVQVNIPCQIEDAFLIVDAGKLAGGIDEQTLLNLRGDEDVMTGHRKREGIDVFCIVSERALESVASVRCRDGNALQVVVAGYTHGCGDHGTGISRLIRDAYHAGVGR